LRPKATRQSRSAKYNSMARNSEPEADCLPAAIYDGTRHIGSIVERGDGRFDAIGVDGELIGTFKNQIEAMRSFPGGKDDAARAPAQLPPDLQLSKQPRHPHGPKKEG
jgi:hypothetical protein